MSFSKNRRRFLGYASASGLALPFNGLLAQESGALDYDALINVQYANRLRLRQAGGLYMDANFQLSKNPETWTLALGAYDGVNQGDPVHWRGYWIFNPEGTMCWQAINYNGGLDYWNQDGKAKGNPQDWELFKFEKLNPQFQTVRIKNAVNSGGSVGLIGNRFNCSAYQQEAAVFYVEFDHSQPARRYQVK